MRAHILVPASLVALAGAGIALYLSRGTSPGDGDGERAADPAPPASRDVADDTEVAGLCGACHAVPDPHELARVEWQRQLGYMRKVAADRGNVHYTPAQMARLGRYFAANSPRRVPRLPPDPTTSPVAFGRQPLGFDYERPPSITNVNVVDLDRDGALDVLVCEDITRTVSWIRRRDGAWKETVLAATGTPGHTAVADVDADGDLDVAVAVLGDLQPTERRVGAVVLLENTGHERFVARTLLSRVGRVADVEPGDLDGDGDVDFAVASFGFVNIGEVGWLEHQADGAFAYHTLLARPGAIHVPVVDLDGDGHLDIVAVVSQETEEVVALAGDGAGGFTARTLFAAGTPMFGATGIEIVDLDRDGDPDVLLSNGDALDVQGAGVRPFHGVQWLENRGPRDFVAHDIGRFYGVYRATAGDLDGDGDLDVAVAIFFSDWADPGRQSLLWLENDGHQQFTAHGLGSDPIHLTTAALGDLDGDGAVDIVTGGVHVMMPPRERDGRVTVWWNRGR